MDLALPLLGRESGLPGVDGNRLRFFGAARWDPSAPSDALLNPPPDTWTERDVRWSSRGGKHCGLWRLSSYGITGLNAAETLPLSEAQLLRQATLPTTAVVYRKCFPIWLKLTLGPSGDEYYIDPGGTIEFWADGVDVSWVAPPTWIDADKQPVDSQSVLNGIVFTGLLYAELRRIEAAIGPRRKQLTQHIAVPANTSQTAGTAGQLRIPRGAMRVQISRDGSGAVVSSTWAYAFVPQTGTAIPDLVGVIPINGRISQSAVPLAANVSHIIAPDIAEDALWTVIWEIEP